MAAMPGQSQFGGIGIQPVAPTGISRLWPIFRATVGTAALGLVVLAWEAVAPVPMRPSTLMGNLAARVASTEVNGTADAHVALQQRMNALNIDMQTRLTRTQAIIQQQMNAMQGQTAMADFADMFCLGSMLVGGVAQANGSRDIADTARNFARGSCGVGDAIRVKLSHEEQAIYDGHVTEAVAGFDHHHYTDAETQPLIGYFKGLAPSIQHDLTDGATSQDVVADRVLLYFRTHDQSAGSQPTHF